MVQHPLDTHPVPLSRVFIYPGQRKRLGSEHADPPSGLQQAQARPSATGVRVQEQRCIAGTQFLQELSLLGGVRFGAAAIARGPERDCGPEGCRTPVCLVASRPKPSQDLESHLWSCSPRASCRPQAWGVPAAKANADVCMVVPCPESSCCLELCDTSLSRRESGSQLREAPCPGPGSGWTSRFSQPGHLSAALAYQAEVELSSVLTENAVNEAWGLSFLCE